MPSDTLIRTLDHVVNTLDSMQVPTALIDGLALPIWKHIRATRDIDLLAKIEPSQVKSVLKAATKAGIRAKRAPALLSVGENQILQLRYEPPESFVEYQIDLLLANSDYLSQALVRKISVPLPVTGRIVGVVTCEDLILLKLIAGRIIDRADASAVLKANRHQMDLRYVQQCALDLDLKDDFLHVWDDAFPGESFSGKSSPAK